ncbi:polyphosphate kinase 2 family protein [Methanoregula sp.]|jgi:PPK2 family polyphosphate:nucleotide phosphotransferase|uniref:polyphosphate kinase 2 family protein n=1 Tax=Methanoregula sp. TaxID=2052170 RepID=UPI003C1BE184
MEVNGPNVRKYLERFIAKPHKKIRLKKFDTGWVKHEAFKAKSEEEAKQFLKDLLAKDRGDLAAAQDILAASRKYGILIVLQGMDTSGKDGTIRHVMSGVNPQGCQVYSFKVPDAEDHAHDFLWRYEKVLPERGMIGIFNRSYYEDVLVVQVHPERMEDLPAAIGPDVNGFWEGRYKDINAFEKHLVRNGTVVLKFFLNISKEEQKRRLIDRLSHKEKYWKFSYSDVTERQYWDQYMAAYEEMLESTSTAYAPWFIVPADHKWMARTFVAEAITSAITGLNLSYPEFSEEQIRYFSEAKKQLEEE